VLVRTLLLVIGHVNSVLDKYREIGSEFEECLWTNDFTVALS
jgi:hypothetical protein